MRDIGQKGGLAQNTNTGEAIVVPEIEVIQLSM